MKIHISSTFSVKGRGNICITNCIDSPNAKKVLIGDIMVQNGEEREILGIESYSKLTYPPLPGDNIGFLYSGTKLEIGEVEIKTKGS